MLNWNFKPYSELSLDEFHDAISLRMKVFIIEQNCTYQDLDGLDKACYHLLTTNEKNEIVGTARIIPPGLIYPAAGIGRIALDASVRGGHHGHQLMKECMQFIFTTFGKVDMKLSAQKHLEKYYNHHGFRSTGKEYFEDGIPHVEMINKIN
jgi:ElaA protein